MVGIGDDDATVSTPWAAVAYVVVVALLAAWWWFLSGLAVRDGDSGARVGSTYRGVAWWPSHLNPGLVFLLGSLLTFGLKLPALALDTRLGIGAAAVFEVVAWVCVLWMLGSVWSPSRGDGMGDGQRNEHQVHR